MTSIEEYVQGELSKARKRQTEQAHQQRLDGDGTGKDLTPGDSMSRAEKEQVYLQTMYGDGKGNVEIPEAPTTQREKIHVASKTTLIRAGRIAALKAAIHSHQVREKKTVPVKNLARWENTEPHSTEAPLAGRRGKKTRRQRKSGR